MSPKAVIIVGDGMADEPIPGLGGRTPLQVARTPAMDAIARDGVCGAFLSLPDGFPTGSEVANLSILGCDVATEYSGRGPLEAAGRGIPLLPDDVAFRLNLTTLRDGILEDFSAGHIGQTDAEALVEALNDTFGTAEIRFYPGISYRHLLVLSGAGYSPAVRTEKPDDLHGCLVTDHMPKALTPDAEATAKLLRHIVQEAPRVLETHRVNRRRANEGRPLANGVWPWSGGRVGTIRALRDRYGIRGAAISAVDVIRGIAVGLGMDVLRVPGATGYVDTNYEGKAEAAVQALDSHDLVYLHVEAIDEVSHERDLAKKIQTIEDFDARCIARVLQRIGPEVSVALLPDHPVPVATGRHTRTPVPLAIRKPGWPPDWVSSFDEIACPQGCLGLLRNGDLMRLLFGSPAVSFQQPTLSPGS